MCGNKFVFLVFGKSPFLLRWKNVVSVSHPLHLRFSWNKPVTRTVISVHRPFIMRYISGKRAFSPLHFRYSCGHCLASMPHIPIARALSGRGDKFCHRITKFCTFLSRLLSVTYPFPGVTKPLRAPSVQRACCALIQI